MKQRIIPISCIVRSIVDANAKCLSYSIWKECLVNSVSIQLRAAVTLKEVEHAVGRLMEHCKENPEHGKKIMGLLRNLRGFQEVVVEPPMIQRLRQFKAGNCCGSRNEKSPKKHEWKARLVFSPMIEPGPRDKFSRKR